MPDNIILYLFIGIFAGVFTAILTTYIAKFLKGKITIKLFKKVYHYGDEISGTFTLHAKKAIKGQHLSVHLIGYQRESGYSSKGHKHTRQVEFTRFSQHVESDTHYDSGMKRDYEIKIQIPSMEEIFSPAEMIDFGDGLLGSLARYTVSRAKRAKYSWEVRVDLEAEGLDISSNKHIYINQQA